MPFNYFIQLISFFTPWKHKKNPVFLYFQGIYKETSIMKLIKLLDFDDSAD